MAETSSEATLSRLNEEETDSELIMYKKQAVNVVTFKIVYDADDIGKKDGQFKPFMAHQVFGESESIFGYRSLSIDIYYMHNSSRCYVDLKSSGKIKKDLYEADDIIKALDGWLPENYSVDKKDFLKQIESEEHDKIYGEILGEFKDTQEVPNFPDKNINATYKIAMMDLKDPNFIELHKNFETLIVWFIDAANFIDLEDDKWMIFYVYEEFNHPDTKKLMRSPVGFCTLYKFFHYPDKIRARISQYFILPTHQRRGIGSKMYKIVFEHLRNMPDVIDITVEEPTSTFQKIRDINDSQLIYDSLKGNKLEINIGNRKKINELMKKVKLCKKQSARIFDILGCHRAKKCGPFEYNNCLNTIKRRIENDLEREQRAGKRFCPIQGATLAAIDTKSLVESEFKRYIEDITPSVKYLVANML
ncbi:unnamed protein product [Brassicogethes aeneus]|uniref:histone acetyltransferase n=1 Tax=Brassicogethes aeneus TaxID=1431903 RepID=A0A9P0BDH6_BRAAE|nr:unnamed protein product [Brassicogethes aeneus]